MVIQSEAEAALKVREAQQKEPGRAGAGSPLQAVLPPWQEPKQGCRALRRVYAAYGYNVNEGGGPRD